ncbi:MAG: amino acid/amide transporter substrate-binding protein family [Acidimicrobiales bacterium]|nr:amino acid/amide transporter substrate-binding protein family [Acidimicrobiales bacterium]
MSDHVANRRIAVLLLACTVLAACGTRLPDQAFVDARQQAPSQEQTRSEQVAGEAEVVGPGDTTPDTVAGPAATTATSAPAASGQPAAVSNKASDVGVTETSIKLGTIVAENGVLGDTFAPAATGLRSWAAATNAAGGIGGRKVELVTCDDREDRGRTLECARKLVESDKVFALIATNTRSMGGAAQYLNDHGIPVLGNPINNSFYRYPHFFSVYGSPYRRDGRTVGNGGQLSNYSTVYRYFREKIGSDQAAVFSYDIAESAQAGDAFQKGLEVEGFKVTRYVVSFAAPSFDSAVADMQRKGTKVVLDSMDEGANRRLCDAMERRGFSVGAKVSTIPLMGDSLAKNFGDACRPVTYVPGDSLPYTDKANPFVARYRDAMARYQRGKELHQWGLEAWAMAQMLQDYLVKSAGAPTRKGFEQHLLSLRAASPAGIMTPTIQYGAATARDCVAIAKWDDKAGGWISATPFPYCIPNAKQYATGVAEQGN